MLEWLDRNLDFETSRSRSPATRRRGSSASASSSRCLPCSSAELLRAARRLSRRQPRRPVLERAARGACLRTARGLPPQRRPSRARRGGGDRLRRRGGAARRVRAAGATSSTRDAPRFVSRRLPTSPTATSQCCADERSAPPAGARRLRACAHRVVAGGFAPLRRRRRLRVVDRRRPRSADRDRAPTRIRRRSGGLGSLREAAGGVPPRPLQRVAAALARVVAPARPQLLPRAARNARLSGVRPRLRDVEAPRAPHRPRAGHARGDARARARGRSRCRTSVSSNPDRSRPRPVPAGRRRAASQCAQRRSAFPSRRSSSARFSRTASAWAKGSSRSCVKGPDTLVAVLERLREADPGALRPAHRPCPRLCAPRARDASASRTGTCCSARGLSSARAYHAVDVCLVTSRQEGGPKAVLESMAAGVPLVTTRVGQAAGARCRR